MSMQTRVKPTSKAMHGRFTRRKVIVKMFFGALALGQETSQFTNEYQNFPFSEEEIRVMSSRNLTPFLNCTLFSSPKPHECTRQFRLEIKSNGDHCRMKVGHLQ